MPAISLPEESASRTTARHLEHRETSDARSDSNDMGSLSGSAAFMLVNNFRRSKHAFVLTK
jgi:hypothetical protein